MSKKKELTREIIENLGVKICLRWNMFASKHGIKKDDVYDAVKHGASLKEFGKTVILLCNTKRRMSVATIEKNVNDFIKPEKIKRKKH